MYAPFLRGFKPGLCLFAATILGELAYKKFKHDNGGHHGPPPPESAESISEVSSSDNKIVTGVGDIFQNQIFDLTSITNIDIPYISKSFEILKGFFSETFDKSPDVEDIEKTSEFLDTLKKKESEIHDDYETIKSFSENNSEPLNPDGNTFNTILCPELLTGETSEFKENVENIPCGVPETESLENFSRDSPEVLENITVDTTKTHPTYTDNLKFGDMEDSPVPVAEKSQNGSAKKEQ